MKDPYGNQTSLPLQIYYAATNNEAEYGIIGKTEVGHSVKSRKCDSQKRFITGGESSKRRVLSKTRKHGKILGRNKKMHPKTQRI